MKYTWFALVLLAIEVGCYDPNAHNSKIVREIEAAGSGDLHTFTEQGLQQWFSQRSDFAVKVAKDCVPLRKTAKANWNLTAEGSACNAAWNAAVAAPVHFTADPRGW